MERLRKLAGRLASGGRVARSQTDRHVALGEHGDHWGCVFRSAEEAQLLRLVSDAAEGIEASRVDGGEGKAGPLYQVAAAEDELGLSLLYDVGVISAYPEVRQGPVWDVTVREVLPFSNGFEAHVSGACHGASVIFFDTRYALNRERYQPGKTYPFHMGAFAYMLEQGSEAEVESEVGAKVSFKGAHAFMPAATGNELAEVDDYWFHSPLEGEARMSGLMGRYLQRYIVTLGLPHDFEMRVALHAADHVTAPDVRGAREGDDLQGFLWLQGHLAD